MADTPYSVGNLQISFSALDKTGKDFADLAKNLRAVVNIINRISTADLGKFTANVKEITRAFTPFLNKINKSTAGLQAFNDVARQVGIKNMSAVVGELEAIDKSANEVAESIARINSETQKGDVSPIAKPEPIKRVSDEIEQQTSKVILLQRAVAQLKSTWLKNQTAENQAAYFTKVEELNSARTALQELTDAKKKAAMTDAERAIAEFNAQTATRRTELQYYRLKILQGELTDGTVDYRTEVRRLVKELDDADKVAGKLNKGSFSKFLGKVGRIALYRTIRRGLQLITQTFTQTIQAYAQVDDGINQTVSSITTSMTTIKYGLGSIILPLLQTIEPVLKQISVGFANMANVINASMSKTGYYTKINTDRLLAYNKAANLFDFDKFRSLNKGDDATSLFSTEKVEDLNEELGNTKFAYSAIYNVIQQISVLAGNLFETVRQIISAVVTSPITAILLNVAQFLIGIVAGVVKLINKSGLLKPIVNAILIGLTGWGGIKVIGGLTTLYGKFGMLGVALTAITVALGIIGNWDNFSAGTKRVITIVSSLITLFTGLAIAILAANSALTLGTGVALAITAASAGAVMIRGIVDSVRGYANGGMPDKGELFYAGEAGAEMVYNTPSGQSGVANVQQIAQAVYQGTYQATMDWWKTAKNEIGSDVYLDSEKIYQGVGRAAGKHGKRFADVR